MDRLFVLGINHRYAPVEIREKLAFPKNELPAVHATLLSLGGISESAVISTCNRVEIYGASPDPDKGREEIARFLGSYHSVDFAPLRKYSYFYLGRDAVRHLFRVASGLDSMVVGESEILGQVKESYRVASRGGNVKSLLHQLFERGLRTAKRVREETEISRGAVSVSSVAVELAQKIFGRLSKEKILILGTGKISEQTMRRLIEAGSRQVWVVSRTPERARELAVKYGIEPLPFDRWKEHLREADVVITSTTAPHPVVGYEDVKSAMAFRKSKPLFVIDLGVPRNTEERVNTLDDVFLYDIDDLKGVCESNLKLRSREIGKCESIIEKQVDEFARWMRSLESAPTIRKLKTYLDQIIDQELEAVSADRKERDAEDLRRSLTRVKGKLLHGLLTRLKEAQLRGGGQHYIEALHSLFELDKVELPDEEEKIPDREPGKQPGSLSD
jgi:glutamyl-tRNA reductase